MHDPSAEDAALLRAWDEVDRGWDDPETHRRFIALAGARGRLADAARRYREAASTRPERDEAARRMLDRILALAMQGMAYHREPPDVRPRRVIVVVGYLVALALLAAGATLLLRGRS